MRKVTVALCCLIFWAEVAKAEVPPVEISAAETTAWTGERVRIKIELRAPGSFSGSAGFDLPEIPGTLLLKVGNPVVSSTDIEGESWFVQTHEFALFSQKTGTVTIPAFSIRFEAREGFTGPANPVVSKTEPLAIEIQRPPGSENIPFLVTTDNLQVTETWDPDPGEAAEVKVGDVFRRTIVQRSSGQTGMALAPALTSAPEGVRVYDPQVETSDNTERGAFDGERRETLTYLLQQAGSVTLPSLEYTWWNPKTEVIESKTLPGIEVSVIPPRSENVKAAQSGETAVRWIIIAAMLALIPVIMFRSRLVSTGRMIHRWFNPPSKVVARKLRKACRGDDSVAADQAWTRWRLLNPSATLSASLEAEVLALHRFRYGRTTGGQWDGKPFWAAFSDAAAIARHSVEHPSPEEDLPPLNSPVSQ